MGFHIYKLKFINKIFSQRAVLQFFILTIPEWCSSHDSKKVWYKPKSLHKN